MKLLTPLVVLVIVLGAVLWLDEAAPDADLVFVNSNEIYTLDPQRMSYMQDLRLAHALYEGLVRWDNADFSIEPAAAEAMPSVSADGRTYTFTIRTDARWSNGDAVTVHDFIYAWRRAMLPDTAADYSNLFFVIDGAREFFDWRVEQTRQFAAVAPDDETDRAIAAQRLWKRTLQRFDETVGLRALDDHTLEVTLERPTPYFLDLLCFGTFCPVHQPTVDQFVELDPATGRLRQGHGWAKPGRHVGNGPYVLEQWRYKRDLRLRRNPMYHRPGRIRSDTILALTIEDTNTAVLAFESGAVDWLIDVSTEYEADMIAQRRAYQSRYDDRIDTMLAEGNSIDGALASLPEPEYGERRNIHVFPAFATDFYSFNCRPTLADGRANPFADAAVRRAFALAVDKRTIVDDVTRLREPVVSTLVPPGSIPGYDSPEGLSHDPERARTELAAAGWRDRDGDGLVETESGDPFPVVDLLYTTNTPRYKWISLELKAQWERTLGVRIELRGSETKFYKEDLKQGKFMIARGRWYGDYGDPTTFLDLCRSTNGNNDRGFASARIDAMLDAAANERDPQRRLDLLADCERVLFTEELPLVPICQLVQIYMYEPGELTGLSRHPRLVQYLSQIECR